MADIETQRLQREEKRRQRRERIRRILEDDDTPSRRSKEEKGVSSPGNERSSPASRRAKERGIPSSSENRTRARQEEARTPEGSTRTDKNVKETSSSSSTKVDADNSTSSLKARREARRRRNQEHESRQNKVNQGNGGMDGVHTFGARSRSGIKGDSGETRGGHVVARRREKSDNLSETDRSGIKEDNRGSRDRDMHAAGRDTTENSTLNGLSAETGTRERYDLRTDETNGESQTAECLTADEHVEQGDGGKVKGVRLGDEERLVSNVDKLVVVETNISTKVDDLSETAAGLIEENGVQLDSRKKDEDMGELNGAGVKEDIGNKSKVKGEKYEGMDMIKAVENKTKEGGFIRSFEGEGVDGRDGKSNEICEESTLLSEKDTIGIEKRQGIPAVDIQNERAKTIDVVNLEQSAHHISVDFDASGTMTEELVVDRDSLGDERPVHSMTETQELDGKSVGASSVGASSVGDDETKRESPETKTCADLGESGGNGMSDLVKQMSSRGSAVHEEGRQDITVNVDTDDLELSRQPDVVAVSKSNDSSIDRKHEGDRSPMNSAGSGVSAVPEGSKEARVKSGKSSRTGKLKVDGDSWCKNPRKKRGIADKDRAVELTVLGRTGKIKGKLKTCEAREVESADLWKKEVKKGSRRQKSLDEETEKELRELSRKSDLKSLVKSCEEKDQDSADAWKREVKKNVRKHRSLDEDTESELKELSKTGMLKSRINECEKKDTESAEAFKRHVKKGARKHKSLDEETEKELRELSKVSPLKDRIKECEEKDSESAKAWKKEVKKGDQSTITEETETSEELKEFAGTGRLKSLIASCAERDDKRGESWKTAKEKKKALSADEEAELKELSKLNEVKNKIIQSYEEKDKEGIEVSKLKSFDDTKDEELKELSKTVDVKTRIQSRLEEQEKSKEIAKRASPSGDENLNKINVKERLGAFKEEGETLTTGGKIRDHECKSGIDEDQQCNAAAESEHGMSVDLSTDQDEISREIEGRRSPTKDDVHRGRTSPTKRDKGGRVSPVKDDANRGRTSPTKEDKSGRASPNKDVRYGGRTSPTKGNKSGRVSPTKKDSHRTGAPATKQDKKGDVPQVKDHVKTKSKLENIRSNLYEGSKSKIKSKRESLERVSKSVSIKDKIAACKERDKMSPRNIPVEKTQSKMKPKTSLDSNAAETARTEGDSSGAKEDLVPVNRMGDQFMTIEEEIRDASIKGALSFWQKPGIEDAPSGETGTQNDQEGVDVDVKGKMSFWESPKRGGDEVPDDEKITKTPERPASVVLGNAKRGWQKRNRKLNVEEFIKELLSAKCKRRELMDIEDVKSDTKKYLVITKGEEKVKDFSVSDQELEKPEAVEKMVELENKENLKIKSQETQLEKTDEDFSFDDVVQSGEVKQLQNFADFRRQVRPTNRRAAKSNPVRKLQQREDVKTETDLFVDIPDEEDATPKPTASGRLGRPIEPGDRKSKDQNMFTVEALAGLSAKEDVSKITLKKTAKSKTGVSTERSEHDGTAPIMLLQIKGHRHMQTRLVEPSVESLNSADAFILVTSKQLHMWLGKDANVMKKSKASELSNKILQYKLLNCSAAVVTIIKDGSVNIETGLNRNFWSSLGGKKSVKSSKQVPKDGDYEKAVVSTNVIFEVDTSDGGTKLKRLAELCGKIPSIKMLDSDKAFVFDFGTEVYAWLGRTFNKATRVKAVELAQDVFKGKFIVNSSLNPITPNVLAGGQDKHQEVKRPSWAVFGRMTERSETILFEQKFLDWPDASLKAKLDKKKDLLNRNLSSGYAKRKAKMEETEVQFIELVPYDGAKMAEEPPTVKMILEGVNVGRGRGSYNEIERRGLEVTTNAVTVYHSSDKEYRQLKEREWGHFYSSESYVIRWSYSVKASGIRSLKGGESKRDTTGRDMIAYFFWHGRDCSASGKGTSALATIELDSDKSPQIMVDQGDEPACFLNLFDGQMIVHHGKRDEAKSIDEDNVLMYCVQHEHEKEVSLIQIEARSLNLRSRSSFVVVVIGQSVGICIWHGAKSTEEKREGALRGAKRLAVWFKDIFDVNKTDIVELDEGNEGNMFWEALDGKNDYGTLLESGRKSDYRLRLFQFTSTEGPFLAKEILNPTRGDLVSPYPFKQSELYDASQPALFLVDVQYEMYLWQGWWPVSPEESEATTNTGSAEFRWHRDRRLAMQTIQSYADVVGRQMSKSYVVNAGLEPVEFRAFFSFWEDQPDVTRLNLESGKTDGEKASLPDLLAKLSRDRYSLAELRVRPLPEGVDPSKLEIYLSDEEFKDVFNMTKDDFTKMPKWKKLEQRKQAGLF